MLLGPVPSQAEPKDSKKRQCSKLGNRISTIAITPVGLPRLRSPLTLANPSQPTCRYRILPTTGRAVRGATTISRFATRIRTVSLIGCAGAAG